ncbi:MAG: DUF3047 domain-containing protein [Betaproteobacteria bacterium]|nr:DUF3047 domain-containing protein [Betaproteobacteria bacterium]
MIAIGLLGAGLAYGAAQVLPVAAFSANAPGAPLPQEWMPYGFEKIKNRTSYELVRDGPRTVLQAEAKSSASGLVRKLNADPGAYPLLRWSWKVSDVVKNANLYRKDGDDFAARIYVTFDYPLEKLSFTERAKVKLAKFVFGEDLPLATLCYVWDARAPIGTMAPSAYSDRVRIVVVESGADRVNRWVDFERDLRRDFLAAFGETPPAITAIAVATDTDNTGTAVTAWFGDITLNKP